MDVRKPLAIAAIGIALVGLALSGAPQPATAQVTTNTLSIPDTTHEGEDTAVTDVVLAVDGSYSFETNNATGYEIDLAVASDAAGSNYETIAETSGQPLATSTGGTYSLSGSLLEHSGLSAADFSADSGETVTRDVPARVTLTVMGPNGELVTAVAEGTATVTVTSTAVAVTAEVSGTGDVTVSV